MSRICLLLSLLFSVSFLCAQTEALVIEAEAGTLGADYEILTEGRTDYVSITTNGIEQHPESSDRVISYEITFPKAGTYDLYVKFRVGPNTFDDDSYFYGNGFGVKSPTEPDDWQTMNQLAGVGYVAAQELVEGAGTAQEGVWKWLNFSLFTQGEPALTFTVDSTALTQTFQIGAREDGLEIDKLAFGESGYFYTVTNLENGEAGSQGSTGLQPIAEGKDKFLGNTYSGSQIQGFANYWNKVTPENAGKWGSVETTRDNMNWTSLDIAYRLAKDNGFPFQLHVMIWGNQQPSWIENLPPAEQLEEIEEWFAAVADRYPDIDFVEVVNEPLHDPPNQSGNGGGNYLNALGGSGTTGWDWIVKSFELGRQYFPNAQLMINDYNIVNSFSSTQDYKEIVEILMADSLIDAIGVQAHAFTTTATNNTMRNNLNRLGETGLPIYVTEMEIDGPTDAIQLAEYQRIFPLFWEHPSVQGITLWGWRTGLWRNVERAYLMNTNGVTERPALEWLRGYVSGDATNIIEEEASTVLLFPNPMTDGNLYVQSLNNEIIRDVRIFDMGGRLVFQSPSEAPADTSLSLTPQGLAPGVFSVQVVTDSSHDCSLIHVR